MPKNVRDVMRSNIKVVRPETTIAEAGRFMLQHSISAVPVVDEEGRVLGLLSKSDIVRHFVMEQPEVHTAPKNKAVGGTDVSLGYAVSGSNLPGEPRVAAAMSRLAFDVSADDPLSKPAALMLDGRIHRLLVLDGDHLIGLLSSLDLLKAQRASEE